jgi:uncharacterized membrane protein
MALAILDLVSILLSALVFGVYWGPWLALSRSMNTFDAEVFLAIVHRMDRNMGTIMTLLMPLALISIVPVLVIGHGERPQTFFITLAGLLFFVLAAVVTIAIEVPIVSRIRTWTIETIPAEWAQQRDRWMSFHRIRVGAGFLGLALLLAGALFGN